MNAGPRRDNLFKVIVLIAIVWGLLGATGALNGTPIATSTDEIDITSVK